MGIFGLLFVFVRGLVRGHTALATENLALRQQLNVLRRSVKRVRLRKRDRVFWALLSRIWKDWRSCLMIVKPETVVRWHRYGFRRYWRWKSGRGGRPRKDVEVRTLIRRMSRENMTWGAPRIQSELRLLGYEVAESPTRPSTGTSRSASPVGRLPLWTSMRSTRGRSSRERCTAEADR